MNLPALKCKNRRLFNITGIPAFFITIFLLTAVSCGQSPEEKSFVDYPVLTEENEYPELTDIKAIFYDLYSPVKAHRLFQQINVVFDPDILNPVDNVFRYSSSNKIALNLGIYGADMSFCHMFGQTQEAINYMSAVYRLSERLGIAGNIITEAENARESTIYNPDSLFNIASNIYIAADRQLKESGREGAASLILAGGWIEAFYIACSFYDKENPDSNLEEQILTQKYSLDRLTAMLSNHQNNEFIAKYLLMIRQLQHKYDSVEILFSQDDLIIDTTKKTIESDKPKFVYTATDIEEIIRLVTLIRQEMVN
ncbi:MAG: hypothetical protein R6U58_12130 [Bacteroidales bacterium]